MAQEFPHCNVVGVDLAPIQTEPPLNCRIEVDDINLGLEHFYGCFDFVHARLIASGIKDYYGLLDEISKTLRPGGMFLSVDWDFRFMDYNKTLLPAYPRDHPRHAWFPCLSRALGMAIRARMGNIDAAVLLPRWLRGHRSFEEVDSCDLWVPSGDWFPNDTKEGRTMNAVGRLMKRDTKAFVAAGRPLLLSSGLPEAEVDELIAETIKEVDLGKRWWVRVSATWARKKGWDTCGLRVIWFPSLCRVFLGFDAKKFGMNNFLYPPLWPYGV